MDDINNFWRVSYRIKIPPEKTKISQEAGRNFAEETTPYFSVREPSFEAVDSSER